MKIAYLLESHSLFVIQTGEASMAADGTCLIAKGLSGAGDTPDMDEKGGFYIKQKSKGFYTALHDGTHPLM